MRRVLIVIAVLAALGLGFLLRGERGPKAGSDSRVEPAPQEATIWTCSMHPQIKLPHPGKCPICFMDLIPLDQHSHEELGPRTLQLSAAAAALADIRTSPVVRRFAQAELALIGRLDYDETLQRTITAWVPGRIDTLFVNFTGDLVTVGEPLVSLYSPELYSAQTELLSSIEAATSLASSTEPLLRRTAAATVQSSRKRLKLWGLSPDQIAAIETRGTAADHIRIPSPLAGVVVHKNATEGQYVKTGAPLYTVADLSRLWLIIDAYESDLPWLRVGQTVDFTVSALPGQSLSGKIVFIDPILNSRTRTAAVRVEVPNPDGSLKPGLFATVRVSSTLDDLGKPATGGAAEPLVIPATAPLITGRRAVVYVRDADQEKPTFTGREVVLGPRTKDAYIVLSGLSEGELVVTNGAFKIDSALQIQAKPSMMSPEGGAAPDNTKADTSPAPPAFREQLEAVLNNYLQIQQALAADNFAAANAAASAFPATLKAVDMTLLKGEAHLAWMSDLATLEKSATALKQAPDIAGQRDALLRLGPSLWTALKRFGYREDRTVRKFHCPMADHNKGGDWIQLESTTANPFFGSAMPRCGSQTDSLVSAADRR